MDVLIWVQHLLGTGHLRRAMTLAAALAERGLAVTVASGGPATPWLLPGPVELVQLPPVHADLHFTLVTGEGAPLDAATATRRRDLLLALLRQGRPRVVITEMFPFGRRAFRSELVPLLEAAAALRPRPWLLASVRDILVHKPERERHAWMRDLALAHYHRVLVHADPALIPFELTFPFTAELGTRLVYTGYLCAPPPAGSDEGRGEVLVSAGGGRVGRALLEAALRARALTRHARVPWRLVGAGGHPELASEGTPGVVFDSQRADFTALLANSLLSVSQAGYNTVVEALKLGKPLVLVPFETASETEQRIRAQRLMDVGLAHVVWESGLNPGTLAAAVDAAVIAPRRPRLLLDLGGADRSARLVVELLRAGEPAP